MASMWGGEGRGEFLREVVGSVGIFLFPSFSFALRLSQVIMRSRSIIATVRVDS